MKNQSTLWVTFNGNEFSRLMYEVGMSIRKMAELTGYSISSIKKFMSNSLEHPNRTPDITKITIIASALNCEVEDLYEFK